MESGLIGIENIKVDSNDLNQKWKLKFIDRVLNLINRTSYLSDNVKNIISSGISVKSHIDDDTEIWSDKYNCLLRIDHIDSISIRYEISEKINYMETLKILNKYFTPIRLNLTKNFNLERDLGLFLNKNDIQLFRKNIFETLFISNFNGSQNSLYTAYLSLFSMLERGLGDILYSLYDFNSTKVPFLLRDLVDNLKLSEFCGNSCIRLLKPFVHTPHSLNLRNLVWHGFFNPSELNEDFLYFIISILVYINSLLNDFRLQFRLKINFSTNFKTIFQSNLKLFENFQANYLNECLLIIDSCKLIDNSRKFIWKNIFETKRNCKKENFNKILTLLPQIEHFLRKLYSIANNILCKETQVYFNDENMSQIAHTNEFYLTLDDLITPIIKETNQVNHLCSIIDQELLLIMHDLFMYLDGPRLRDRISHGELESDDTPDYYIEILSFISISLALIASDNQDLQINTFLDFYSKVNSTYEINFHPIIIVKHEYFTLVESYNNFRKIFSEFKQNNDYTDLLYFETYINKLIIEELGLESICFCIEKLRVKWRPKLFARYVSIYNDCLKFESNENQILLLLNKIFMELKQFMEKLLNFKSKNLDKKHDLRERQRNNLKRFDSSIFLFDLYLNIALKVIILIFHYFVIMVKIEPGSCENVYKLNLTDIYGNGDKKFPQLCKFLKLFLQQCQNLNSKSESNEWLECEKLITMNQKFQLSSQFLKIFDFLKI